MSTAKYWKDHLNLIPHPEGGYYKETYRSNIQIETAKIPGDYDGPRSLYTCIYYLLEREDFSAFHKVASDEFWYFLEGANILIHQIDSKGELSVIKLGRNIHLGETLLHLVPANTWFCAEVENKSGYALVSCSVHPGFDFKDFEMGSYEGLMELYPKQQSIIRRFTRS